MWKKRPARSGGSGTSSGTPGREAPEHQSPRSIRLKQPYSLNLDAIIRALIGPAFRANRLKVAADSKDSQLRILD
jgi:hypothetical protein